MSFGSGLSGMNAASQQLDVIGNNISNSGTAGFKSSSVNFADVYASSRIGLGVGVAAVQQNFAVGNIKITGNQFDMAIDGEKGLFRLQDAAGNILYSRNGQFSADKDGNIINAQGQYLTGYVGANNTTVLSPLKVPYGNIPPLPTNSSTLKANFDASSPSISIAAVPEVVGQVTLTNAATGTALPTAYYKQSSTGVLTWYDSLGAPATAPANGNYTSGAGVPVKIAGGQITSGNFNTSAPDVGYVAAQAAHPFSATDPDSYTHSMPMSVYDSLGNAHQLTQYFVKRGGGAGTQSNWDTYYLIDGKPVDTPASGGPVQMVFDSAGRLTSTPTTSISILTPGTAATPADPMSITIDYSGSTQFSGSFSPNFTQNGYATGDYSGLAIGVDGTMTASYTNGQTQKVGIVSLSNFQNVQGLKPVGGNAYIETSQSGQPINGIPGQNGIAQLKGQAVEESNVDMSQELVEMIVAQRSYQANAQTLKTQDQIMQTVTNLR